jgi:hypothetical protein
VQKFSQDPALLERLDSLVVSDIEARILVEVSCLHLDVPEPLLKFHARRSMFTGATERPRSVWVEQLGESEVQRRESNGWGSLPAAGAIRLGRSTTMMTIAHELGHHLVFFRQPWDTPAHGRVWVGHFDEAAGTLEALVSR